MKLKLWVCHFCTGSLGPTVKASKIAPWQNHYMSHIKLLLPLQIIKCEMHPKTGLSWRSNLLNYFLLFNSIIKTPICSDGHSTSSYWAVFFCCCFFCFVFFFGSAQQQRRLFQIPNIPSFFACNLIFFSLIAKFSSNLTLNQPNLALIWPMTGLHAIYHLNYSK